MTDIYPWRAKAKLAFSSIHSSHPQELLSSLLLRSSAYKQQGTQALLNPKETEGPKMKSASLLKQTPVVTKTKLRLL